MQDLGYAASPNRFRFRSPIYLARPSFLIIAGHNLFLSLCATDSMASGVENLVASAAIPTRLCSADFSSLLKSQDETIARATCTSDWGD